jgi:hypothetical protein
MTAIVVLATTSLFVVTLAMTRGSVSASIDNKCVPAPGSLVVPAGKTAKNFRLTGLSGGNSCYDGRTVQEKSFKLGSFSYVDRNGTVTQGPGTLAVLALGPGTHRLTVGGGKGAVVGLTYELWP